MASLTIARDAGDAYSAAKAAKELWEPGRNKRFEDDQALIEQHTVEIKDSKTRLKSEVRPTADASAHLLKAAALLTGHPPDLSLAAPLGQEGPLSRLAQSGENWCRSWRRRVEMRHADAINNPLFYDEARYLLDRGWLCQAMMLNPVDPQFPYWFRTFDPYHIFPCTTNGVPYAIYHIYHPPIHEVKQWGKAAENIVGETKGQFGSAGNTVEYVGIYTAQETAELLDGKWLKRPTPHNYGFNPLHVTLAQGSPYQATDRTTADWTRFKGEGLISVIRNAIRNKEDLMTMLRTIVAKLAAPPTIMYTFTGEAENDIPYDPGTSATRQQGESYVAYPPPAAALQGVENILSAEQATISMGGLGQGAWGGQASSGFQESEQQTTAIDILMTFVAALKLHYVWQYATALKIYRLANIPLTYTAMAGTVRTVAGAFIPEMVDLLDLELGVEVRFRSLDQSSRFARANLGATLVERDIISPTTARDQWADVANPEAEEQAIILAKARRDPLFVRLRGLKLMAETSDDPIEAQIAGDMYQSTLQQFSQQQAMQAAGMTGGGQPALPSGRQPPPAGSGQPSAALPDEMAQNAGAGPNGMIQGMVSPEAPPGMG